MLSQCQGVLNSSSPPPLGGSTCLLGTPAGNGDDNIWQVEGCLSELTLIKGLWDSTGPPACEAADELMAVLPRDGERDAEHAFPLHSQASSTGTAQRTAQHRATL